MSQEKGAITDAAYTVVLFLIVLCLTISMAYVYTAKWITNPTFFWVYFALAVVSTVGLLVVVVMYFISKNNHHDSEDFTSALYVSNRTKYRPLSHPIARAIAWGLVIILTMISVFAAGALFPTSSPFADEAFTKSMVDNHGFLVTFFSAGIIPGFFEELPIFLFSLAIAYGLLLLVSLKDKDLRTNGVLVIVFSVVGAFCGALLFMFSHSTAYGLNGEAYLSAFMFEFIVQLANQFTGIFLSWIPHMLHNILVVYTSEVSFSIGGTVAAGFMYGWNLSPTFKSIFMDTKHILVRDWKKLKRVVLR